MKAFIIAVLLVIAMPLQAKINPKDDVVQFMPMANGSYAFSLRCVAPGKSKAYGWEILPGAGNKNSLSEMKLFFGVYFKGQGFPQVWQEVKPAMKHMTSLVNNADILVGPKAKGNMMVFGIGRNAEEAKKNHVTIKPGSDLSRYRDVVFGYHDCSKIVK